MHQHSHCVHAPVLHVPLIHQVPAQPHRLVRPLPGRQGRGAAPQARARHPSGAHDHQPRPPQPGHQLRGQFLTSYGSRAARPPPATPGLIVVKVLGA